jgi:hypothetical protein
MKAIVKNKKVGTALKTWTAPKSTTVISIIDAILERIDS